MISESVVAVSTFVFCAVDLVTVVLLLVVTAVVDVVMVVEVVLEIWTYSPQDNSKGPKATVTRYKDVFIHNI